MMWCAIFMVTFTWHVRNKNSMEHLGVLQTADSIYTIISHISVLYIVFHRRRWKKEIEVFSTPHLYVSTVVCRSIKISTCLSLSLSLSVFYSRISHSKIQFSRWQAKCFSTFHTPHDFHIYTQHSLWSVEWSRGKKNYYVSLSVVRLDRNEAIPCMLPADEIVSENVKRVRTAADAKKVVRTDGRDRQRWPAKQWRSFPDRSNLLRPDMQTI